MPAKLLTEVDVVERVVRSAVNTELGNLPSFLLVLDSLLF
jgi:hypothetical protein